MKAVVEMQFIDFVTSGFNQVVKIILQKIHYRWGQNADICNPLCCGAGVRRAFHSQSNEAWFFFSYTGTENILSFNPYDAKGMIAATIEDPNW